MKQYLLLAALVIAGNACAVGDGAHEHHAHSPYVDFTDRTIKALSAQQIADLQAGKGMSLALPAELNGYPGPAHVLTLSEALHLSAAQQQRIQMLFDEMTEQAKQHGVAVIAAEQALDALFRDRQATARNVKQATEAAARTLGQLRYTHLQYHLATMAVLDDEQIVQYSRLRGYAAD